MSAPAQSRRGRRRETLKQRTRAFWSRIKKRKSGCWEWTGATVDGRYGNMGLFGGFVLTHRFSWELANGPIPSGFKVLHKCDNGICCRPGHLFLGTQKDNIRDMHAKNRAWRPIGELCPNSVLTAPRVRIIKRMIRSKRFFDREIARSFGVARVTINHIRTGRTWKHVT